MKTLIVAVRLVKSCRESVYGESNVEKKLSHDVKLLEDQ